MHLYISLITDVYSHKIVGYHVAETLEAVDSIQALKMAPSAYLGVNSHFPMVHNSDETFSIAVNNISKGYKCKICGCNYTRSYASFHSLFVEVKSCFSY